MGTIYLIRHGQASFGAADYDQLSPLGEQQSRLLGEWLQRCGQPPARVVIGPMKRHRQTAAACLSVLPGLRHLSWQVENGFAEFDHHEVLIRHRPDLVNQAALRTYLGRADHPQHTFQQLFADAVERWIQGEHHDYTESWVAFKKRCCDALLALLGTPYTTGPTWVFTSGGPIGVIVQYLLAIPDQHIFNLNWTLANTGITRLMYRSGQVSVGTINGFPHLEVAGEPHLVTYR
ncbi:histidine phosphatase family protein [Chitinivorax sp. B]|uniref:histidine phosphatase family protein n=1 Tax=Chitinivorax sp. B TaxID=2502235 RepID=UPI0010F518AC|nr:histidine phosphatase family protein [Chitinivorax sp. B]